MAHIPKVKEWRVRVSHVSNNQFFTTGVHAYIVLAPTAQLAILNLRHYGIWGSIVSGPAAVRKQRGYRQMVTRED